MLPSPQILSRLLGKLYDATADRQQWTSFLQELASVAGSDSAAMLMRVVPLDQNTVAENWGLHPDVTPMYQRYYGAHDVWMQRVQPLIHADWIGTSESICALNELVDTEFFNDYLRVYGLVHAMWCVVENTKQRMVNVSLYRNGCARSFSEKDTELLHFLSPHLKRAFRLHSHFGGLQTQSANLQAALDTIPTGAVLLGEKGRIIAMNRAASDVIAVNDGLVGTRNGLRAESNIESERLQRLIASATATSSGTGLSPAGGLQVSRKNGPPLQVFITPVGIVNFETAETVRAVAFVIDPTKRTRPPQEVLRTMFGLTPAECRVALLLADGKSPCEVLEVLGVSVNTFKSHIRTIYAKTGTSRQSQLIRLLLTLAAGSQPV